MTANNLAFSNLILLKKRLFLEQPLIDSPKNMDVSSSPVNHPYQFRNLKELKHEIV